MIASIGLISFICGLLAGVMLAIVVGEPAHAAHIEAINAEHDEAIRRMAMEQRPLVRLGQGDYVTEWTPEIAEQRRMGVVQ